MGWGLIASAVAGSPVTATTSGVNTTGATLLLITANCYNVDPSVPTVISDNKGNTWTRVGSAQWVGGSEANSVLFYAWGTGLVVGTGHTVSVSISGGNSFQGIVFAAFSGAKTSATPLDQTTGSFTGGALSTKQPGSITPSVDGALIVSSAGAGGPTTVYTVNSGFTVANFIGYTAAQNESAAMGYLVQGAAAAVNPTWTFAVAATNGGSSIIASFLPDPTTNRTLASTGAGR